MTENTEAVTTRYVVEFERIGRNHSAAAQTYDVADADELCKKIWRFARAHLGSRDFTVTADFESGQVLIGGGRFGAGTVRQVQA